ncbi:MAG TPA: DNA/RNA nuclease SfsA [Anaerolineae bacterium]|nr:DNA/RNA nuclease SfsA [Anaerolineae bacterium]
MIRYRHPLVPARFLHRENRFRVTVEVEGDRVAAHLPNSGRLEELLTPDRPVWLEPAGRAGRKTAYDLRLVCFAGVLVSVDARLPNSLLAEALTASHLTPFTEYPLVTREVRRGESRLDFHLNGATDAPPCWIETKSVTLVDRVQTGLALFPDAPTVRGRRHLKELAAAVADGERAAVVFVVQRSDATRFAPNASADAAFATALAEAARVGVELYAYTCQVTLEGVALDGSIPVDLDGGRR